MSGPGGDLTFSVVICTYNPGAKIRETVRSVADQTYPRARVQIVVVDDGSTQDLFAHLKGLTVTKVVQPRNMGLAAARNAGIKAATGDIVCFTDDDCVADHRWLEELARVYRARPEVNGVGGAIVPYRTDTVLEKYSEYAKNPMYSHTRKMDPGKRIGNYLRNFFGTRRHPLQDGERIDSVMGANSSYRRELLKKAGGCDPTFRRGVDWELNVRLRQAGGNFVYCARAVMVHKHRSDWKKFFGHVYSYGRVYPLVVRKHPQVGYFPYPLPYAFWALCVLSPLLAWLWRWDLPLPLVGWDIPILLGILLVPLVYVVKEVPYGVRVYGEVRSVGFVLALPWVEFLREMIYDLGSAHTILTGKGLAPPKKEWN